MDDISVGFYTGEPESEYRYAGIWYKPWTWLRWEKNIIIKEVTLFDVFIVNSENDNDGI